jgi:hypothetical protein
MDNSELYLQEVTWHDIRTDVYGVNPQLGALIDQIDPSRDFTFIKARYHYGDDILTSGKFCIPNAKGDIVPLTHHSIPKTIKNKLNYRFVPMGLVLSKSVEVFFETQDRVMPANLYGAGSIFGLWQLLDPEPSEYIKKIWNLKAGARTCCLLPMVSDNISHTRLKRELGISAYPPKRLLEQHKVFIDIAKHSKSGKQWHCDVLYFSNKWAEDNEENVTNLRLRKYCLAEAWRQSFTCRSQMNYDAAWETFAREITRRNLKPKTHIISTIKQLMSISDGVFPGFAIAQDDEALPTRIIQDAYIYGYNLKQVAPLIMCPKHLSAHKQRQVYYSLSLPTLLDFAQQASNSRCIMDDMRELKMLIDILQNHMDDNRNSINYSFFHCENDRFGEIMPASKMLDTDSSLVSYPKEYGPRLFPENSPFFRGCIRIALSD